MKELVRLSGDIKVLKVSGVTLIGLFSTNPKIAHE
jgi:hypothetical protein